MRFGLYTHSQLKNGILKISIKVHNGVVYFTKTAHKITTFKVHYFDLILSTAQLEK